MAAVVTDVPRRPPAATQDVPDGTRGQQPRGTDAQDVSRGRHDDDAGCDDGLFPRPERGENAGRDDARLPRQFCRMTQPRWHERGRQPGLSQARSVLLFLPLLRLLARVVDKLFLHPVTCCWMPHSSRTFMPSATSSLGVTKLVPDFLGGWGAQGSDKYAHVATRKNIGPRTSCVNALNTSKLEDPLGSSCWS